jgi:GIY-YIG catalytic domain
MAQAINPKATAGVYALVDPRTERVMYVGQSIDIDYRYRQHVNLSNHDGNSNKHQWVFELDRLGLSPVLRILAECQYHTADELERQYIRHYKSIGQCELNKASGGPSGTSAKVLNVHADDWYQLSLKIRRARKLLTEIWEDSIRLAGAKGDTPTRRVWQALDKAIYKLEGIVRNVFPEWKDVSQFFRADIQDDQGPPVQPDDHTVSPPSLTSPPSAPGMPQEGHQSPTGPSEGSGRLGGSQRLLRGSWGPLKGHPVVQGCPALGGPPDLVLVGSTRDGDHDPPGPEGETGCP